MAEQSTRLSGLKSDLEPRPRPGCAAPPRARPTGRVGERGGRGTRLARPARLNRAWRPRPRHRGAAPPRGRPTGRVGERGGRGTRLARPAGLNRAWRPRPRLGGAAPPPARPNRACRQARRPGNPSGPPCRPQPRVEAVASTSTARMRGSSPSPPARHPAGPLSPVAWDGASPYMDNGFHVMARSLLDGEHPEAMFSTANQAAARWQKRFLPWHLATGPAPRLPDPTAGA